MGRYEWIDGSSHCTLVTWLIFQSIWICIDHNLSISFHSHRNNSGPRRDFSICLSLTFQIVGGLNQLRLTRCLGCEPYGARITANLPFPLHSRWEPSIRDCINVSLPCLLQSHCNRLENASVQIYLSFARASQPI